METPYAKSPVYWHLFAWAVLSAVLSGVSALIYVIIVNAIVHWLWPGLVNYQPFSGSWRTVAIMTAAGLLVGLIHRYMQAKEMDAIEAIIDGELEPRLVPGSTLVAVVSMAGGFSLGPEVPSGVLVAGLSTWLSRWRGLDEETQRMNIYNGVMSAFAGIFASALAIMFAPLELPHNQSLSYFGKVLTITVSAVIGFSIFVLATRLEFSHVIRILDLPTYDLALWHILLGAGLGVVGAGIALIFGLAIRSLTRLVVPLQNRPILRSGLGGLLLGMLSMALPITMFYGADQLIVITEQAAEIGLVLLLVLVFAKLLATAGALATGFIGGPVFPLFFVGGTMGMVLHVLFPQIPAALAVASLMVAIPAALQPIPLTLSIIVLFLAGIPVSEAIPVMLAGLVAHFVTHGLGLVGQKQEEPDKHPEAIQA